jgi:hypothetical protein
MVPCFVNDIDYLQLTVVLCNIISGDVELTNMQLKPEALNSLKLPVKVKAGFLGTVKLKVCSSCFGNKNILPESTML